MSNKRMYEKRKANIPVMRICNFNCIYCGFERFRKLSPCQKCRDNAIHAHMDALERIPPKTGNGEFITIGLSGDVSFMEWNEFEQILNYCHKWEDRTFLIQSKNPAIFHKHHPNCNNILFGTTIESNRDVWYSTPDMAITKSVVRYSDISQAPSVNKRFDALYELDARKVITIEPILDFDTDPFLNAIIDLKPEWVWIGYDSKPNRNHLPEPPLAKTEDFIKQLVDAGVSVRGKLIRKAWYEDV